MPKIDREYVSIQPNLNFQKIRPSKHFPIISQNIIIGFFDYDEQIDKKTQYFELDIFGFIKLKFQIVL